MMSRYSYSPKVTALALAIALNSSITHAESESEIRIPGLQMPVAVSEREIPTLFPAAEPNTQNEPKVEPIQTEAPPAQTQSTHTNRDLPPVPAQVVTKSKAKQPSPAPAVKTRQEIIVTPGINTLIPISQYQINRIITPFDNPIIQTVSGAEITANGGVIYVTPTNTQPVTMFVTPENDESIALSLTLLPQNVPPIQAHLILSQGASASLSKNPSSSQSQTNSKAAKWEQSQPYVDSLRDIMRDMALGTLPPGYGLTAIPSGMSIPACAQPGIKFDFSKSQLISGSDFRVFVALAQNTTARTLEFDHGACTHPHRAAVSSWPHEILEPGQKTEVFLITRIPTETSTRSSRPSLLH